MIFIFTLFFIFYFCVGGSSKRWLISNYILFVNDGGDVADGVFAKEKIVAYVVVGLETP